MKLEFSWQIFLKIPQISNFMNIRPVGDELFHADGRTNTQTDVTQLKVSFKRVCELT
jgi:hypothetical protein